MEDFMGCKVDDHEKININESCQCSEDATTIKDNDHDEVESARSEMAIAREENTRLKTLLQRVESDYKALQLRFVSVIQESKKIESRIPTTNISTEEEIITGDDDDDREHELVSLRLGTTEPQKNCSSKEEDQAQLDKAVLKTQRSGDEEISQTSLKRARVCVRARCDTPTMNDGGQWRKYGQKISKGNPCPRAYYRCTVSPTCPVRKQVQRCVEDMSILITTYEGTHNHPVPVSAIAMASTTSAAASMLLSGSSSTTSQPPPPHNLFAPPPTFHPYHQPYFLPNSSSSSSTPFPTITLDLTTPNPSTTHGGFGLYSSTSRLPPPTSLNFSSNKGVPTAWGGGGLFSSYGNFPYKNDHRYSQPPTGKPVEEQKYQSYLEKFNQASSQQALTETLTKVITSDASFRSVIAAAISTMTANGDTGKVNNGVNWREHISDADSDQLT